MNNTSKRSSMMVRLVAVLAVVMMFTMCFVGGTFAKYTTSKSGTDSARVAKWGVKITGEATTFAKEYAKDNNSFTVAANTVVSTEDVVAPGTGGNMAAFTITGQPEVAVRVAFTGTLELGDKWVDAGSNYYCPIEIKVGDTTFKGTSYASADLFEEAVNTKIATFTKDYAAGTNLSTISGDAPAISWKWAFEGNDDVKDTYLGKQAAAGNAATISLSVTVTVTQID